MGMSNPNLFLPKPKPDTINQNKVGTQNNNNILYLTHNYIQLKMC